MPFSMQVASAAVALGGAEGVVVAVARGLPSAEHGVGYYFVRAPRAERRGAWRRAIWRGGAWRASVAWRDVIATRLASVAARGEASKRRASERGRGRGRGFSGVRRSRPGEQVEHPGLLQQSLATAAALVGLECDIYMGEVDMAKERPNVVRMKILGANVIPASHGLKTLKEAVDAAFGAYMEDPVTQFYAIGSVVGPHPFPAMVRDFQAVVGREAKEQFKELTGGKLPDNLVACVGGGCNAIGLFTAFLGDEKVKMFGVEPSGTDLKTVGKHAATLTLGTPGVIHGFKCVLLQDEAGEPAAVNTCASGLDYPGVGPEHCYLKDIGRVKYETATDVECVDAFMSLARDQGIIPALESSHAVAHAIKLAKTLPKTETILVNLSGRGDKDVDYVVENFGAKYGVSVPKYEMPKAEAALSAA